MSQTKLKSKKNPTDSQIFSGSQDHQMECIARYKPYFLACGIAEAATWDAWSLWKLSDMIYGHPAVVVAEKEKEAAWRTAHPLKPTSEPWRLQDYLATIFPQSVCLSAIESLPAETKSEIRQRVLAAKETA